MFKLNDSLQNYSTSYENGTQTGYDQNPDTEWKRNTT